MHSGVALNTKDLLVICHSYNDFQKSGIEGASPFFRDINVLVRTNIISEMSHLIPLSYFNHLKMSYKIDLSNTPYNISVIPTPILYLPWDGGYRSLGPRHLNHVINTIKKDNLSFDLIHSHFLWSAGYVGAKLKKKYGTPLVVTAHGYDIYSLPFRDDDWKDKIKQVLDTADLITTVSQNNIECINQLDVKSPVELVLNGFRKDLFQPRDMLRCREVLNLPSDKRIILTIGGLQPIKGQRYLIDAINIIAQERDDVLCIIVGGGKLESAIKRQIYSLELNDSVFLVGRKTHDSIPIWINACDVFVLPSLNEGNPTVMLETLACGKPFVGSRVGGIPEIIISDRFGFLVEPRDPESLAEKIMIALDKTWDKEGIIQYAQRFTSERMSLKMAELYNRVLGL